MNNQPPEDQSPVQKISNEEPLAHFTAKDKEKSLAHFIAKDEEKLLAQFTDFLKHEEKNKKISSTTKDHLLEAIEDAGKDKKNIFGKTTQEAVDLTGENIFRTFLEDKDVYGDKRAHQTHYKTADQLRKGYKLYLKQQAKAKAHQRRSSSDIVRYTNKLTTYKNRTGESNLPLDAYNDIDAVVEFTDKLSGVWEKIQDLLKTLFTLFFVSHFNQETSEGGSTQKDDEILSEWQHMNIKELSSKIFLQEWFRELMGSKQDKGMSSLLSMVSTYQATTLKGFATHLDSLRGQIAKRIAYIQNERQESLAYIKSLPLDSAIIDDQQQKRKLNRLKEQYETYHKKFAKELSFLRTQDRLYAALQKQFSTIQQTIEAQEKTFSTLQESFPEIGNVLNTPITDNKKDNEKIVHKLTQQAKKLEEYIDQLQKLSFPKKTSNFFDSPQSTDFFKSEKAQQSLQEDVGRCKTLFHEAEKKYESFALQCASVQLKLTDKQQHLTLINKLIDLHIDSLQKDFDEFYEKFQVFEKERQSSASWTQKKLDEQFEALVFLQIKRDTIEKNVEEMLSDREDKDKEMFTTLKETLPADSSLKKKIATYDLFFSSHDLFKNTSASVDTFTPLLQDKQDQLNAEEFLGKVKKYGEAQKKKYDTIKKSFEEATKDDNFDEQNIEKILEEAREMQESYGKQISTYQETVKTFHKGIQTHLGSSDLGEGLLDDIKNSLQERETFCSKTKDKRTAQKFLEDVKQYVYEKTKQYDTLKKSFEEATKDDNFDEQTIEKILKEARELQQLLSQQIKSNEGAIGAFSEGTKNHLGTPNLGTGLLDVLMTSLQGREIFSINSRAKKLLDETQETYASLHKELLSANHDTIVNTMGSWYAIAGAFGKQMDSYKEHDTKAKIDHAIFAALSALEKQMTTMIRKYTYPQTLYKSIKKEKFPTGLSALESLAYDAERTSITHILWLTVLETEGKGVASIGPISVLSYNNAYRVSVYGYITQIAPENIYTSAYEDILVTNEFGHTKTIGSLLGSPKPLTIVSPSSSPDNFVPKDFFAIYEAWLSAKGLSHEEITARLKNIVNYEQIGVSLKDLGTTNSQIAVILKGAGAEYTQIAVSLKGAGAEYTQIAEILKGAGANYTQIAVSLKGAGAEYKKIAVSLKGAGAEYTQIAVSLKGAGAEYTQIVVILKGAGASRSQRYDVFFETDGFDMNDSDAKKYANM